MKLKTYCLGCREHTNNMLSKNVVMRYKVIRSKSICTKCLSDKSRFMAQEESKSSQKKNRNKKWSLSIMKQTY